MDKLYIIENALLYNPFNYYLLQFLKIRIKLYLNENNEIYIITIYLLYNLVPNRLLNLYYCMK